MDETASSLFGSLFHPDWRESKAQLTEKQVVLLMHDIYNYFLKKKRNVHNKDMEFCFNIALAGLLEGDCHCWIPIPVCLLPLGRCFPSSLCYTVKMLWGVPPAMVGILY